MKLGPIGGYFGILYRSEATGKLALLGLDADDLNDSLRYDEASAYQKRDSLRALGCWAQVIQFGRRDAESVAELIADTLDMELPTYGGPLSDEDDREMRQATSMAALRTASDETTATTTMEMWTARKQ